MENRDSHSRRRTLWDDTDNISGSELLVRETVHEHYDRSHTLLGSTNETNFLNTYKPEGCPYCGSVSYFKFGKTKNNINRFKCKDCDGVFTPTTGTIFDHRKIPVTEWVEYLLNLFRDVSITAGSWNNRNAFTTSRYWLEKVFLVLDGIQDKIVLSGDIWFDETYISERKSDIELKEDGQKYRGHSRNQYCIGVATDGTTSVVLFEGMGHPSSQRTFETFAKHIAPGSRLIHDKEKSHLKLITELSLDEQVFSASAIKKLPSKENPLQEINKVHSRLKHFLRAHSGFNREDLQGFLDLFAYVMNPPEDRYVKVSNFLNLALTNHKILRYHDYYKASP